MLAEFAWMASKKSCLHILCLALIAFSVGLFATESLSAQDDEARRARFRPVFDKTAGTVATFEWNRRTAAHLMRRAGFSASLEELDRLVEQGFALTLEQLLNPESIEESEEFEEVLAFAEGPIGLSPAGLFMVGGPGKPNQVNLPGQRDLWLYRMVNSRRQLQEKMAFFWHDHFATSGETVFQVTRNDRRALIAIQHRLIRKHALGNFHDFVQAIAKDPAMLRWLDGVSNVAGNPNENFGRELLELFTIGIGNYTEKDIQEAARAFTGWTFDVATGDFLFLSSRHDQGEKIFLGLTGNLDGDQVIDRIFEQTETARFIARKLWSFLAYADPEEALIDDLGTVFRDSGYEIRLLLKAIFERPEFFSERAFGALVKSPTEMTVNFFREVGFNPWHFPLRNRLFDVEPLLARLEESNQLLFDPPDVSGWPSGRLWLDSATIISRFNFFADQVAFREATYVGGEFDRLFFRFPDWLLRIIGENGLETADDFIAHLLERFLQAEDVPDIRLALEEYLGRGPEGVVQSFDVDDPLVDVKIRGLLYLILTLPEYQMN